MLYAYGDTSETRSQDQEPGPRDRAPGKGKQLHRKITQSPASSTDQHQEPGTVNRETENNQGVGKKKPVPDWGNVKYFIYVTPNLYFYHKIFPGG